MGPQKPRPEPAIPFEKWTSKQKEDYYKWKEWDRTRIKSPNEGRTFYSATNSYDPPEPSVEQPKKKGLSTPEKFFLAVLGLSIFGD